MNRVFSDEFPDTVRGVVFDRAYGVQFTPTVNGAYYNTPSQDSIRAAKMALEGYRISEETFYFMNPRLAASTWISRNRPFLFGIGNHSFYG